MSGPKRFQYTFAAFKADFPARNELPGKYIGELGESPWRNPYRSYSLPDGHPQQMFFVENPHYCDRRYPDEPPVPFPADYIKRHSTDPQHLARAVDAGTSMSLPSPYKRYLVDLFRERCLDGLGSLEALRGHNLYCDCLAGQPCHGDLLIELANRPRA